MEKRKMWVQHPGVLLREEIIDAYNLSVKEAADLLGVTRVNLSEIVNLKRGISPEMAIRVSNVFGGTPGLWAKLQWEFELNKAEKSLKHKPKPYPNRITQFD